MLKYLGKILHERTPPKDGELSFFVEDKIHTITQGQQERNNEPYSPVELAKLDKDYSEFSIAELTKIRNKGEDMSSQNYHEKRAKLKAENNGNRDPSQSR